MPYHYTMVFSDFHGQKAVNRFYADFIGDAIWICEDLVAICAASWIELRQNGSVVTVSSPAFNQAATDDAFENELAILHMSEDDARQKHVLKLHAPLPAYLSDRTLITTQNPFRAITFIKNIEGGPLTQFQRATYQYRNRKTRNF